MSNQMNHVDAGARRYSPEVKAEAVWRALNGELQTRIAADVGCHVQMLYKWVKLARAANGAAPLTRPRQRACPHCSELIAALRLVLASADGSRSMRDQVNQIAVQAMHNADAGAKGAQP